MQKITNAVELKEAILELEERRILEEKRLTEQFSLVREWLSPANLIKTTATELFSGSGLARSVLGATFGLSAGLISKKFLFRGLPGRLLKGLVRNLF
jgi:hypothetical protein